MKKAVISLVVIGILIVTYCFFKDTEKRKMFAAKVKVLLLGMQEKVERGIEETKKLINA